MEKGKPQEAKRRTRLSALNFPEDLLKRAKIEAAKKGTTMTDLFTIGLRLVLIGIERDRDWLEKTKTRLSKLEKEAKNWRDSADGEEQTPPTRRRIYLPPR
jgi:hypothetical protein